MGWNLPPGVTDRMIDEQSPGYYDDQAVEPTELDLAYEEIHRLRIERADLVRAIEGIAQFSDALTYREDDLSAALREWIGFGRQALAKTRGDQS